jgi:hypothetical protein
MQAYACRVTAVCAHPPDVRGAERPYRTAAKSENGRQCGWHHKPITRRTLMKTTGAAAAATLAAPFVRTAGAAGSLSVGYWDHWVPGANTAMTQICEEWAEKEKVNLTIDYLATQGNKLYLTIAAEALARSGHVIMDLSAWEPSQYANQLEPVEDVMAEVLARNGPVRPALEYLAKPRGTWLLPASSRPRSRMRGPGTTSCSPPRPVTGLEIRSACRSASPPTPSNERARSSMPLAPSWSTATATSPSNPNGVGQVLDYAKRLSLFLLPDLGARDNASNNKFLVSGRR